MITYPDRALILRLPEPLLRARGTLVPPDDWPEGTTLGLIWRLEAVYAGVSALTADPPPPVDTQARVSSYPSPAGATSAPSRASTISCPLPARATLVPPPAWVTSALSSWGATPPVMLV